MQIRLSDGTSFKVTNVTEQKLYLSDGTSGWAMQCKLFSSCTLAELEEILTDENIHTVTLVSDDGETQKTITGYDAVAALNLRYDTSVSTVADIKLVKGVV